MAVRLLDIHSVYNCVFQTDRMLYIVTEAVSPLTVYLENNDPHVSSNQLAVSWGLHQISVSFILCLFRIN
jgi:hypothetical protein